MGLTLPDKKWNLVDVTVPLQSSPSVTVTAGAITGNPWLPPLPAIS